MKKRTWIDTFMEWLPKVQLPLNVLFSLYVLIVCIYRGIQIGTLAGVLGGIIAGFLGAILIFGFYFLLQIWDITTNWLTVELGKYPKIRRSILILFMFALILVACGVTIYWKTDNLFKFGFAMFFIILLPSALLSIIQEDKRRERFTLLGTHISPQLVAENPQAAVEHAFTYFEDRLRSRLGVGSEVFGENLINLAYGKNGKLSYGDLDTEKNGVRNFLSGAYAAFRNPRKHRMVNESRQSALEIIGLIETMVRLVEESSIQDTIDNSIS